MMGNIVLQTILKEIKQVLYYSLVVDSTPDCSHTDQLAIVLRYVFLEESEPKERLLKLLPGIGHSSSSLEEAVINCLSEFGLDIKYLRGQSFDNASNMSGAYTGLQARIKQHNPLAEFVPCAGHSLNLVGSAAAECCTEVVKFFGFIQELYNFFSVSTHRWDILKEHLDKNNTPVVKSLSVTRWSARADALKAVVKGYKTIQKSLIALTKDPVAKPGARLEAQNLEKQFRSFENAFLCTLWNDILERVDKCSNNLQKQTMNLTAATKQLHTLESYVHGKRDEFDNYEQSTIALLGCETPTYSRVRKRKIFADETNENEMEFDGRSAFRTNVFLRVIDSLISNLARRKKAYEVLSDRFEVLSLLVSKESSNEAIAKAAVKLPNCYPEDISSEFANECSHFKMYVELEDMKTIPELYKYIRNNHLTTTFPNLEVAIRIFLTLPVTNCTAERGFSVLARVKNAKRSTLREEKLNSLVLMCSEHDITLKTNFSDIVNNFAQLKLRKKSVI